MSIHSLCLTYAVDGLKVSADALANTIMTFALKANDAIQISVADLILRCVGTAVVRFEVSNFSQRHFSNNKIM